MNQTNLEANRRAAWRWGGFVVVLLSLQVIGGILAIWLAGGDATVAVVPNYHEKALRWDEQVAVQTASDELGWKCEMHPTDTSLGRAGLYLKLADQDGLPVRVRSGQLRIYRHARASDVRRVNLPAKSFGVLQLGECFDHDGLWQVTIDVTDDGDNRFVQTLELRIDLSGLAVTSASGVL